MEYLENQEMSSIDKILSMTDEEWEKVEENYQKELEEYNQKQISEKKTTIPFVQGNRVAITGRLGNVYEHEDKNGDPYASCQISQYAYTDPSGKAIFNNTFFNVYGENEVNKLKALARESEKEGDKKPVTITGSLNQRSEKVNGDWKNYPQTLKVNKMEIDETREPNNKVVITGNLKWKSELKYTKTGNPYIRGMVTNSFKLRDADGKVKTYTDDNGVEHPERIYQNNQFIVFGDSALDVDKMEQNQELKIDGKFIHKKNKEDKTVAQLVCDNVKPGLTLEEVKSYYNDKEQEREKSKSKDKDNSLSM